MLVTNIENKKNKEEKRILLVDDEQDVLLTFQLILLHEGYKVYPFDNPLDALSSFKIGLYDLAILDIKMPKMDGFQLYEEIKKIDCSLKVCFITAAAAAATGEETYQYYEITEKNEENAGQKAKPKQQQQQQQQQQQYCELQKTMFLKKPISNGVLIKEVNRIIM
jgi:CheY-like chemotaxis protein